MEKYRKIIEDAKINGNWFRLGKTFHTSKDLFFLDTGTGKIFKIKENVFRVLDCLFKTNDFNNLYEISLPEKDIEEALSEICEAISTQSLFSAHPLTKERISVRCLNLEEELKSNMNSVTLELTERCNLRCKYCVYSDVNNDYRFFGENEMTFETASKAVDFLMKHSNQNKKVYIGLYGGEPLLRFPLIKQIVEYVSAKYPNREVSYSMTSNMTLMTAEIAEYLVNIKDMSVVISLDGPKEIHDRQRVFKNGEGTFSATMNGLKTYMKSREKSINQDYPIVFSTVIELPYTKEKFEQIDAFFKSLRTKYTFTVLCSYVSKTSTPETYVEINDRPENVWSDDSDGHMFIYDPLAMWTLNNLDTKNFGFNYFRKSALLEIHNRSISDSPMDKYSLNGCCIPGARRLYVTATGDFLPCERVGTQLPIGNINRGFDIELIRKHYINDFIEQEIKYCGECWAVNICNNCYMNCLGSTGIDFSHRHKMCRNTRHRISESLSIYHEVMASNPEMIQELNDIMIE